MLESVVCCLSVLSGSKSVVCCLSVYVRVCGLLFECAVWV